jgi:protein phosphatase
LVLPEQAVFAVADGVGGYEGGQVASSLAVEAVRRIFVEEQLELRAFDPRLPRRGREVAEAMLAANHDVFEAARSNAKLSNMGTTLVAARFALNKQRLYLGHVGDSRCYRLRDRVLRQLTTDHTMEQLGFTGPRAKDLTRAIGMERHVDLDLVIDKPCVDDVYLLCSDGLTKMVDDGDIRDAILAEQDIEAAVYNLIERANEAGGRDNVTVLLVKVLSAAPAARSNASSVAGPV